MKGGLKTMKSYNGFRSWNAWNVSLWINNDENLYYYCQELLKLEPRLHQATLMFMRDQPKRTNDI